MAKLLLLLFGIIVFQVCIKAAPSEPSEPSEDSHPAVVSNDDEEATLDSKPNADEQQTNDNDASQSQRQKRFYDYLDYSPYDYPATSPYQSQPHHSKRDGSQNTAVFGTDDPLSVIFRRLQDIIRDIRYQNEPRPVQTPIPAFIPIYIPQFDCGCSSNTQSPSPPVNDFTPRPITRPAITNKPPKEIPTTVSSIPNVTLGNRDGFDDTVQNSGKVTNRPGLNDLGSSDDGDGSRPINFDIVPPEEPLDVPVPPVDHGTVQEGVEPSQTPNEIAPPSLGQRIPAAVSHPSVRPRPHQDTTAPSLPKSFVPSLCDGAIVTCCNRAQVTEKCFEANGCEDPSIYGQPCDPKVQLMVISKFQDFHKRRAG